MPHLDTLYLWFNSYTESLPGIDIFSGIPKLRILDLRYCNASSVPDFASLKKLEKIDVSFNKLTQLPKNVTSVLDKLAVNNTIIVGLSEKPLSCHCDDEWFVIWTKNTNVQFANRENLKCEYPGNKSLVNPLEIDLVGFHIRCSIFRRTVTTVFATLGSMCILLIVLLIVRKRWTIRYWLHAARNFRNRIQGTNARCRHSYRYDAFAVYSSRNEEERKWVHFTLRPKLEEEYGFKLCLHHRDFIPGYDIVEVIEQSIQDSNKVLLILSPAFLESDWCQFEVHIEKKKLHSPGEAHSR